MIQYIYSQVAVFLYLVILPRMQSVYRGKEYSDNERIKCPVSSLINTELEGIYSYPIDLFDSETYSNFGNSSYSTSYADQVYNCTSSEASYHKADWKMRPCSTLTRCPLMKQNILDSSAFSRKFIEPKHSFCKMRQTLHYPSETINVLVLGGSITHGSNTVGCCCNADEHMDSKCASFDDHSSWCLSRARIIGAINEEAAPNCKWSSYLKLFFRSYSEAQVNLINLAHGGWSSSITAGNFSLLF